MKMRNTRAEVKKVLAKIRPMLQADGGDVELISVEKGVVKLKLRGACHGCPFATMTLQNLIEARLKNEIKGVKKIVSV